MTMGECVSSSSVHSLAVTMRSCVNTRRSRSTNTSVHAAISRAWVLTRGAHDPIFTSEGGESFVRDVPDAELHLLDTGHFALEDHQDEIVGLIRAFYTTRVSRTANTAA
jgi:pimeloyl-ACP methyl ester carboxylesterase